MSAPNIEDAALPQAGAGNAKARLSALYRRIEAFLEAERAQLPHWFVVAFAAGIAAWFALPGPNHWLGFLLLAAGIVILGLALPPARTSRALAWAGAAMLAGCALVWVKAERVAAPRIERSQAVVFTAEVERVEPLAARDSIRLTLRPAPDSGLPPRLRVNIAEDARPVGLARGAKIELRAWLMPPPPMAVPGGHDFARDFWFKGIGGTGRALGEVRVLRAAPESGIDGLRARLDRHIREQLPGSTGTVATAFATGDQNAIGEEDAEAMRRSGLAHLLSVGGLHITAAVGLAMIVTLKLLALSQTLALRVNLVIVAAGAGALAGIGYTLLTGSQVPMVRSCIAAMLILGGLALGRDAISMRLLAVAALVILLFLPEVLTGASFQFTFAAVGAIIALHSTPWARRTFMPRDEAWWAKGGRVIASLIVTGLVVELAVMPFALYHFHRAGLYGVLANVIAIPLTTFVILPLEALSLLADAVGLGAPFWVLTDWSLQFLLWLAHTVAESTTMATIPDMPSWAFAAIASGILWLMLWTHKLRFLGLVPVVIGAVAAATTPAPDFILTGDGRHLALLDRDGRPAMLRDRSGDFVQSLIRESAGFDGVPGLLSEMPGSRCGRDSCVIDVEREGRTWRILATRSGQRIDWLPLTRACAASDIVISDRWLPRGCTPRWLKLDRKTLEATGGIAIRFGEKPRITTVADQVADHPWAGTGRR